MTHITAAARHAKRARTRLQDLMHLDHLTLEIARGAMLESRGLEAILSASRNTATRRRRARRAAHSDSRLSRDPRPAGQ